MLDTTVQDYYKPKKEFVLRVLREQGQLDKVLVKMADSHSLHIACLKTTPISNGTIIPINNRYWPIFPMFTLYQ